MKLEGIDLEALAREHETPFYLYDADAAIAHTEQLARRLPEHVDLYYCAKANACPAVLRALRPHVRGLDVSSAGEIDLAVASGFDPGAMSFAGPGKTESEIDRAVALGVGILSVESPTELERAQAVAKRRGTRVGITLRINPLEAPREFPMKMGGQASPFGIPEEDADAVVEQAKRAEGLHLLGFHVFSGTNCLDADAVCRNVEGTLAIAERLARTHGVDLEVVNLGGGLGVPYFPGQEPLDAERATSGIREATERFRTSVPQAKRVRFILELGRYIVADAGVYVTRVVDVKATRGKRFAILDGGMHHCFPATGNFGQVLKKNYPVHNVTRPEAERESQELVGPLCTPIDSMARSIELPRSEIGDLVVFDRTGAYSFAASPLLFLSHDTPPEIVRHNGHFVVGRARKPATAFL